MSGQVSDAINEFVPFADDSAVWQSGSLSVENGIDEVVIHGSAAFRRDLPSAARARKLAAFLAAIADQIEQEADLAADEGVPEAAPVVMVDNPFA